MSGVAEAQGNTPVRSCELPSLRAAYGEPFLKQGEQGARWNDDETQDGPPVDLRAVCYEEEEEEIRIGILAAERKHTLVRAIGAEE